MKSITIKLIAYFISVTLVTQVQAQDFQQLVVSVPEGISIRSPGDVVISHDLTTNEQVFPDQVWDVFTSNQAGANVNFTIGRFVHESFRFFRRNARIQLRVVDSDGTANWTTIEDDDQTAGFFFGQSTASVSAESFGAGAGRLGIRVSFLELNVQFIAAGRYTATVVGQITNK